MPDTFAACPRCREDHQLAFDNKGNYAENVTCLNCDMKMEFEKWKLWYYIVLVESECQ